MDAEAIQKMGREKFMEKFREKATQKVQQLDQIIVLKTVELEKLKDQLSTVNTFEEAVELTKDLGRDFYHDFM